MNEFLLAPAAILPFPNIDPVLFNIGPVAIHWYGIAYVVGILFAWWYSKRLVANASLWAYDRPPMRPEDLDDFVLWAAVGIVVGGRTGYVLFYDLPRYLAHPFDIIAIWQGGMSFHGGMVGAVLAMVLFARSRGINPYCMIDVIAATAPVGLGLVRLANFINSELWGRPSDVPWAIVFPTGGPEPRHPSQLYEACLEGLVLFLVLRLLTHRALKLKTPRFVGGAFLCGYGLSRIFVEFFRMPDPQLGYLAFGWLTMGMILSLPMVIIGLWAMASARKPLAPKEA